MSPWTRSAAAAALIAAGSAAAAPAWGALPLGTSGAGTPTLAPMLKRITPAVVNIAVTAHVPTQHNPLMRDPFFRHFFNVPDQPAERTRQAAGSGVIVDAEKGYVVTNNHVIKTADEIVVTLKDRRTFEAKLVGTDEATDVALLKIDADGLTALPVGDSDRLEVGDFVVAIGNPFALGQTVTSGIVSALGRSGLNIEGYEDFIQTDASINPGNSGGALVNLDGELVGVNTAIIGPSGGNVGIGFAVPSNMVESVIAQLADHGEVRRGRLGVLIQDLTPDLAEALGVDASGGAVITQVQPDSPAEQAGLRAGDVVVEVNGRKIDNSSDLRNAVGLIPIGERVDVTYLREGTRATARARVAKARMETLEAGETSPRLAGATLQNIERGHPLFGRVEGVLVSGIEQGSSAWQHGLREGDVIFGVNRERVHTPEELTQVLGQAEGGVLALNVLRGNARLFIVVR